MVKLDRAQQDWRSEVIYGIVTDRFATSGMSNLPTYPTNPVRWHGGNYKGLRNKIREGYFSALGITAILISPPMVQVSDTWDERTGLMTSPYHAYWPADLRKANKYFGVHQDLRLLVRTAHIHGIQIVLDMVHHLHYTAALYQRRPDWFVGTQESAFAEIPVLDLSLGQVRDYMLKTIEIWSEQPKCRRLPVG